MVQPCSNPGCSNPLVRRPNQKLSAFKKIKYCSRQCGLIAARALGSAAAATKRALTFGATPVAKDGYLPFAREQSGRFWSKVDRSGDGCWLWIGRADKDGYGKFAVTLPVVNGKTQQAHVRAHRLAYELEHGIVGGAYVLHSCDTPACCNPAHLSPGTALDNMQDKIAKGRARTRAALNAERMAEIRRLYATTPITQAELATQFGVCRDTIGRVVRGAYAYAGPREPVSRGRTATGTFARASKKAA